MDPAVKQLSKLSDNILHGMLFGGWVCTEVFKSSRTKSGYRLADGGIFTVYLLPYMGRQKRIRDRKKY